MTYGYHWAQNWILHPKTSKSKCLFRFFASRRQKAAFPFEEVRVFSVFEFKNWDFRIFKKVILCKILCSFAWERSFWLNCLSFWDICQKKTFDWKILWPVTKPRNPIEFWAFFWVFSYAKFIKNIIKVYVVMSISRSTPQARVTQFSHVQVALTHERSTIGPKLYIFTCSARRVT